MLLMQLLEAMGLNHMGLEFSHSMLGVAILNKILHLESYMEALNKSIIFSNFIKFTI